MSKQILLKNTIKLFIVRLLFKIRIVFNIVSKNKLSYFKDKFDKLLKCIVPNDNVDVKIGNLVFTFYARDLGMGYSLATTGIYEPEETKLLKSLLKNGMTYVNVGANFGYYTLLASELVGSTGRVFAFEPDPYNFSLLTKNIKQNNLANVISLNIALSNVSDRMVLFRDSKNYGNPSFSEKNIKFAENSVTVVTDTIDNYFKNLETTIDLIQIDTQGAEGLIIGDSEIIKNDKCQIIMEFWPYGLKNMGTVPEILLTKLSNIGYLVREVNKEYNLIHLDQFNDLVERLESQKNGRGFTTLHLYTE